MAIYDCFTYCGEDLILDLRFNILNKVIDKFVVVEANKYHSGVSKKFSFNLNKFESFRDKIIYIRVENFPKHNGERRDNFIYDNFQRNSIIRGLKGCKGDDIILISDADEIPNPEIVKSLSSPRGVFLQDFYYYKFNFKCIKGLKWFNKWPGTKYSKFKCFESAQLTREIKVKNYNWWRIDKPIKQKVFLQGGWHFSFLMSAEDISRKIKNYAHKEYKKDYFTNPINITNKINQGKDLFDRKELAWSYVKIDKSYPKYFLDNLDKYKKWIN